MKRRITKEGDVIHIYQLSNDKGNIFYERKDFLVFYTLFACLAATYHLDVVGLCLMLNHIHIGITNTTMNLISRFMRDLKSGYAKEYNRRYSRTGALWADDYGHSIKRDDKQKRSFAAYLYNNPVEKHSCNTAEEYQWNFMKYAVESTPFSTTIRHDHARNRYRQAVNMIKYHARSLKPLKYVVLDNIFNGMTTDEERSLTDLIVTEFNCIDPTVFISLFGSYNSMRAACKVVIGREYDINEYAGPSTYKDFKVLYKVTETMGYRGSDRRFFSMTDQEKKELFKQLKAVTNASTFCIQHYIHYQLDSIGDK